MGPVYFLPTQSCTLWPNSAVTEKDTERRALWDRFLSASALTRRVSLSGVCVHVCVLGEVYRPVDLEHAEVLLVQSDVAPEDSCKLRNKDHSVKHIHSHCIWTRL